MALGVTEDTSDKVLERAEDAVAPLVASVVNIVDDASPLVDEYPNEVDGPAASPVSP